MEYDDESDDDSDDVPGLNFICVDDVDDPEF